MSGVGWYLLLDVDYRRNQHCVLGGVGTESRKPLQIAHLRPYAINPQFFKTPDSNSSSKIGGIFQPMVLLDVKDLSGESALNAIVGMLLTRCIGIANPYGGASHRHLVHTEYGLKPPERQSDGDGYWQPEDTGEPATGR